MSLLEGFGEVAAWFLVQFGLFGWDWLLLLPLLVILFLLCFVFCVIVYAILYDRRLVRAMREYAVELGKVVLEQLNLRKGQGWVIRPADAQLERIEVSAVLIGRSVWRWRMLVDLVQSSDLGFEMWRKPMVFGGGRVFAPGDAAIGVENLDARYWIETAMPKQLAALLGDLEVQRMLIVAEERGLRYLRVGGNRIELQFDRGRLDNVRAMSGLAHLLAHRMSEFT